MQWAILRQVLKNIAVTEPSVNLRCRETLSLSDVPQTLHLIGAAPVFVLDFNSGGSKKLFKIRIEKML